MSDPAAIALAPVVSAAVSGDRSAFERLVHETSGLVCAITLSTTRDVTMSEDVAQDVYLEAWKGIGRLRNPASFLPWLRQLARNRSRLALRAAIRRRQRITDGVPDDILSAAADPHADALHALMSAEEKAQLQLALDSLPAASREVLVLYYREGRSVRQVAELLGIGEDAVKQRLARARERVRHAMLEDAGHTLSRTAPGLAFTAAVATALSAATPGVAAAATLGLGSTTAGTGMLARTGFTGATGPALGGIFGGMAGGLTAVFSGARVLTRQARDEEELRGIRIYRIVASLLVTSFMLTFLFFRSPLPVTAAFVVTFGGFCYLTIVYLPRVTARRKASELREEPAAAVARQQRERRVAILGAVAGLVLGGLPIVCFWLL
jgi:RNA polymerase sigma factor (sigma-70 family)